MQLAIRNLSSVSASIEIYALDPASTSDSPVLPTYSALISTGDTAARTVPWPKSENGTDTVTFFVATNDGTGAANFDSHTPSGASTVQVRLTGDGTAFVFFG